MTKISNPNPIKIIEVGKFYFVHDGSKTGHPCYVVSKDDEKNEYLVLKFDSDKPGDIPKKDRGIKHITKLNRPLADNVANSYVKNRPFLCKRRDIWAHEMTDLKIDESDLKLIHEIGKRNPVYSTSFKKTNKK